MPTGIRYTGIDETIRALNQLPQAVADQVRDELAPVWSDLAHALADYPPERPGQRYQRTGTLGQGWVEATPVYIVTNGGSIDGRIENPVEYAEPVQGDDQAPAFEGRWIKASTRMAEYEDRIAEAVERGTVRAIHGVGLD